MKHNFAAAAVRYFTWCAVGALCVGVPFLIAFDAYDLWNSIAGVCGGIVFIVMVFTLHARSLSSSVEKGVIGIVLMALAASYIVYTAVQYRTSDYQREMLHRFRTIVGTEMIVVNTIHGTMIPTFREYYRRQRAGEDATVTETFRGLYGAAIQNGRLDINENIDAGSIVTLVTTAGDSAVRYRVVDTVAAGIHRGFINATGHSGKMEFHATLTRTGVDYERIN